MRKLKTIFLVLLPAALLCPSCGFISSFLDDDRVVARVGNEKLYASEVKDYLPAFVSAEDSVALSRQYISIWALDRLCLKVAQEQLSDEDKDVSAEIEDYRRALIRYRYEQHYVNDRLDTLITSEQINDYYDKRREDFTLERPILKFVYVDILDGSPHLNDIMELMPSDESEDVALLDSLASISALRYLQNTDKWTDAAELAREFGLDYGTMLSLRKNGMIRYQPEKSREMKIAYISDMIESGYAPVDFCSNSIRDMILSGRKRFLLAGLEQDLLDDALSKKTLEIYE